MRRAKTFLINGTILTLSALFMRAVGVIFNIYISKQIGSESVGVFQLVMSVYLFFVTFATSGLSVAVTCILSEELEKRNLKKVSKTIRTCMVLSILLGLLARYFN